MADDAATRRLKAQVRQLERALRRREDDSLAAERVRKEIFGLATTPLPRPRWLASKTLTGRETPGTPTLMLSDWHLGERVSRRETAGVNSFGWQVAQERVTRTIETAISLAKDYQVRPNYAGVVVPILGDILTGEIHEELKDTNDVDLLPLIPDAVAMIVQALRRLKGAFGQVYAPAVPGNHGRKDKKYRAKGWATANFDWLVYNLVEMHLNALGVEGVTIDAPISAEVGYTLHGHRFFCVHGHDLGVKGGDGIIGSIGPIVRGRLKVGSQQAAMGRDFDTLLMGHWHQDVCVPGIIVNNSLKGPDEFSMRVLRAKPTPPSQTLFFTHPHHGITSYWRVFCDAAQQVKTSPRELLWRA